MNCLILSGRLGKDPESKHTQSGKQVVNFSLANSEGFGDKKKTTWIQVVAWEKTAELAEKYLHKGSHVLIQGTLQIREYEGESGKRTATELVARSIEFLDTKADSAGSSGKGNTKPKEEEDDEVPF